MVRIVEYVWTDGKGDPRSKTLILKEDIEVRPEALPIGSFDGSSTGQAHGHFSDVFIKCVRVYKDPFRGENDLIALCETYDDYECTIPH